MNKLYEYMGPERSQIRITEGADDNGRAFYMEGIFIQADVRNHNQRVYPMDEISSAVAQLKERMERGESVLGELDHPDELTINLDRVSHVITDIYMKDNNGIGKLKVIENTPCGKIVHGLLSSNVRLGVSSRGSGNVDNQGYVSDFEIVTVDIVAQPSAPEAYPQTIYESLFNMRGGAGIYEAAAQTAHGDKVADKHLPSMLMALIKELKP